jgi:hypothetical protein
VSFTSVSRSEDEDDAAEVISPEKIFKAADTDKANRKEQARYSTKDKRVFSDMQFAMSSKQHAAATVMTEDDISIAKLKVEAQQKAIERLNELNLAVQREANTAVLATSCRDTSAELRKEDPSLGVLSWRHVCTCASQLSDISSLCLLLYTRHAGLSARL